MVQGDVTRCGGISGLMVADALCRAHARIEALLFAGAPQPAGGALRPDPGSPGLGVELKRADAELAGRLALR